MFYEKEGVKMEKLFSSMQEILSPVNCIVYEIPEFQREYAWGKNQWNALFDDIEANDPGYFIGSIICISGKASGQLEQRVPRNHRSTGYIGITV